MNNLGTKLGSRFGVEAVIFGDLEYVILPGLYTVPISLSMSLSISLSVFL